MGSGKKSSGKKASKPSGSGKRTNKSGKHKQSGKKAKSPGPSNAVESNQPEPEPKDLKTKGQGECKDEQKASQVHDASSRPGDPDQHQDENHSSEPAQVRRRSLSLPGFIAMVDGSDSAQHNTQTEAVLLLRRQALSRRSEPDLPSEDLVQSLSVNPFQPEPSPSASAVTGPPTPVPPGTMYETTNLMDYVENKPPKKTNKNKGKNKNRKMNKAKAKEAALPETALTVAEPVEQASSKEQGASSEVKAGNEEVVDKGKGKMVIQDLTDDIEHLDLNANVADDDCKGKGKQRVDSVESESSSKDAKQPVVQPEPPKKATGKAVAKQPKTPELLAVKDTKPSPSPQKGSRKQGKEKLPVIKEGQVQNTTTETPIQACTPKSTGTVSSTGSTLDSNAGSQVSPQTTAPPTNHRKKPTELDNTTFIGPALPPTPKIGASSPTPSTNTSSSKTPTQTPTPKASAHAHPTPKPGKLRSLADLKSYKPANFVWQLDSHGFPCGLPNCSSRCNLWDGVSVICPKCGPYSETRYCKLAHLLQDIKRHWPVCGNEVFKHPCKDSTIPRDVREASPLVPCLHNYDTPERFRQAVHLNMNHREGDYFIFSDSEDLLAAGFPEENLRQRCSARVIHTVKFEDEEERDRFRRVLAAVLFVTIETPDLTDYLYRMLRDHIRTTTGITTTNPSDIHSLDASLRYQLFREVAITIQPSITGERHACSTDWTGRPRRTCSDSICRSEEVRLLGKRGGGGHKALIEELEGEYWILRSARITHPTVGNAVRRMEGEGYGDLVAEEDRRGFCRGDGWDGAGAGEMEVEGVNA